MRQAGREAECRPGVLHIAFFGERCGWVGRSEPSSGSRTPVEMGRTGGRDTSDQASAMTQEERDRGRTIAMAWQWSIGDMNR